MTEVTMSSPHAVSSARTEQALLIVFADLTRFMANSHSTPAGTLAELLDAYYRHAEGLVSTVGGRVVKFMGDAFLAVWPEERAGAGAAALSGIKRDIDAWWAAQGWDSRVVVKAHFGLAAVGPFGQDEHFDVVGSEVNVAATLPARTVSLSAEAFRCLKNGERKAYKKHTAPVVYIPVDDPRP
jgi:class 3 adenylate cyclase